MPYRSNHFAHNNFRKKFCELFLKLMTNFTVVEFFQNPSYMKLRGASRPFDSCNFHAHWLKLKPLIRIKKFALSNLSFFKFLSPKQLNLHDDQLRTR